MRHRPRSLAGITACKGIHLFCGSLLHEEGTWWNAAIYLAPDGTRRVHRKVNLATHKRGRLAPGTELPVLVDFRHGQAQL
jgi:hypothetical protein